MPTPQQHAQEIHAIARDLDMVVYRLERAPKLDDARDQEALRTELELLRDRLVDVARAMEI